MGAGLRVFLTREQDKTLLNLKKEKVPNKVKDRAEVIRLNAHGWYSEAQRTGRTRVIVQLGRLNTPMSRSSAIMVKVGKSRFVHILST